MRGPWAKLVTAMSPLVIGLIVLGVIVLILWLRARLHDPNFRRIKGDDFMVAQAKIEAQASLFKLIKWMEENPGGYCSVKVALPTEDDSLEHIWVESIKPGTETEDWSGVLANEPRDLKGMKLGSPVTFPQADIEDWMVMKEDGGYEGGYSLPAMMR